MKQDDVMYHLSENIRAYRRARGLSQESLALEAGLNPAFLGHIERCLKCPTIGTLNKIANALGVPIAELLTFPDCEETSSSVRTDSITRIAASLSKLSPEQAAKIADITIDLINLVAQNGGQGEEN